MRAVSFNCGSRKGKNHIKTNLHLLFCPLKKAPLLMRVSSWWSIDSGEATAALDGGGAGSAILRGAIIGVPS